MAKTYNIFISHSWAYSDAYEKFIGLLNADSYFSFKDYSVPRNDPIHNAPNASLLAQAIKQQMSSCHVVIIMAGKYATYSKWIDEEIKIAKSGFYEPKPIIGVKPWANTQVSSTVQRSADELVGWNTSSILTAIRNVAL